MSDINKNNILIKKIIKTALLSKDVKTPSSLRKNICMQIKTSNMIFKKCRTEENLFEMISLIRRLLYVFTKYTKEEEVLTNIKYTLENLKNPSPVKTQNIKEIWLKYLSFEETNNLLKEDKKHDIIFIDEDFAEEFNEDLNNEDDENFSKKELEILMKQVGHIFKEILKENNDEFEPKIEDDKKEKFLSNNITKEFINSSCNVIHKYSSISKDINKKIFEINELKDKMEVLKAELKKQQNESLIDDSTELFNKKGFEIELNKLDSIYNRYGDNYILIFLDITNLKEISEITSVTARNKVLKFVGTVLMKYSRKEDSIFRYDNEELAVLLPKIEKNKSQFYIDKITKILNEKKFSRKNKTISIKIRTGSNDRKSFKLKEDLIKNTMKILRKN